MSLIMLNEGNQGEGTRKDFVKKMSALKTKTGDESLLVLKNRQRRKTNNFDN